MYKTTEFNNSSNNAKIAFLEGKRPFNRFTKSEILLYVFQHYELNPILKDIRVMQKLSDVSEETLKEYFLTTAEWHHVKHDPIEFYEITDKSISLLTLKDIERMLRKDRQDEKNLNKPKVAMVKSYEWVTNSRNHQSTVSKVHRALVYQGFAYFPNGNRVKLAKGRLVVEQVRKKIVGEDKKFFDKMLRIMRLKYNIYI